MGGRRAARTRRLARYAVALLCFGVVHFYVDREWDWPIAMGVVRVGEACGTDVAWISGHLMVGEGGPFYGKGARAAAFNWLWRHTWMAAPVAGFAAAAGVSLLLGGRGRGLETGVTACGWCGYALRGLKEPRCPECGRVI